MKRKKCDICLDTLGLFVSLYRLKFEEGSRLVCGICKGYYDECAVKTVPFLRSEIYRKAPQNLSEEAKAEVMAEHKRCMDALPKEAGNFEDFIFSPDGINAKYLKNIEDAKLRLELAPLDIDPEAVAVIMEPEEDYGLEITLGYLFKGRLKDAALEALRGEHQSYDLEPIGISAGDDAKKVLRVRLTLWN